MAVYTKITETDLRAFLNAYDIGVLKTYEGISAGVSNTNYHVYTDRERYVLTLFEPHRVSSEDVPFFTGYADHLAKAGLPAPALMKTKDGAGIKVMADRPAILSAFLEGDEIAKNALTPEHCQAAGALMGRMHIAGDDYEPVKGNDYGLDCWKVWVRALPLDKIKRGLKADLVEELEYIKFRWPRNMQGGAIHGDYFPDNVFFKGKEISGLIDFHFACTDYYIYDLAIAINAWCFDDDVNFIRDRYDAFLDGYQSARTLDSSEWRVLPLMLRAAALRFTLSRAEEFLIHKENTDMVPHDPHEFIKRLEHFQYD